MFDGLLQIIGGGFPPGASGVWKLLTGPNETGVAAVVNAVHGAYMGTLKIRGEPGLCGTFRTE